MTDFLLQMGFSNACFALALAIVAMVVSSLKPKTQTYANSLLTAIECLVCPALRPPAIASEINSGGFLERRFKMIVSNNLNRSSSRWLQTGVLLGAILILPFGVAFAQDYDAVGRRLRAAVQAGELTGEQARAMLGTLRKTNTAKEVDYEAIGKKIKAAVAAGKIIKEEGRAKMAAIRKEADWPTKDDNRDADLEAIWKKLQAMVKKGELTEEQANAKMSAIKKGSDKKVADSDRAKSYLMKVKKELGAAVESGRISREDAVKRYQAAKKGIKERMAVGRSRGDSKRITREDYAQAEAKMRKMVEDGKAKPEDVERRLLEMRKMMGEQSKRGEKVDWEAIKRRIEGAVKSGKITREEADAKYQEIKKQSSRPDKKDIDLEAIGMLLKAAVKAGKLTEAEAWAKWAEINKKYDDKE